MNVTTDLKPQIGFQQQKVQITLTISLITNGPKHTRRTKINSYSTLNLNNVVTHYGGIRKEKIGKHF